MIRTVAVENGATFITSDIVQSEVARAKGLDVTYLYPEKKAERPLLLQRFFTRDTMSCFKRGRATASKTWFDKRPPIGQYTKDADE